ncbi:MAG: esterase-like activity of phytase family protein [Sandarakinorhabdus sp.]|nr:esterase-like activity of phytase family protein [Sandarakinorhabdus sp.]
MRHLFLSAAAVAALFAVPALAAPTYVGKVEVAGNAVDLAAIGSTPNDNRLSFGSDMFYSQREQTFYGISDRGPGGGTIDFAPRIEAFKLAVNSASGAISNFNLTATKVFRQANGSVYSGLFPDRLPGGSKPVLGNSLDSEGIARLPNGQFVVADEYGPSVYVMNRDGKFLRAFTTPSNLIPREANGTVNYVDGRPTTTTGRQDNRGFEGITVSGDGKKAWAIMQDPLLNDATGTANGRSGTNLRIVEFDVATGIGGKQYIYQLEGLSAINGRIPGTSNDFTATQQGRSIGVSSITWIGGTRFLVIERDNRGEGPDNLIAGALLPVGTKRVYMIDIASASDVSGLVLNTSNTALPSGVSAVSKMLFLDVAGAFTNAGEIIPEKIEGLAIGPKLDDGSFLLLLATDNDFSVTQNGSNVQFDVCTGGGSTVQVALGAACPSGKALVPSRIYGFKVSGDDRANFTRSLFSVPEPASWAMLIAGFGLTGGAMRRRRRVAVAA